MILSRNIPNLIEARYYHPEYHNFSRLSFGVAVIIYFTTFEFIEDILQ